METFLHTMMAKGATSQAGFVADRETDFWIRARRNHKLAQWACDLTDDDQQTYTRLLLDVDFAHRQTPETIGFLLTKIRNDLMGFGVFLSMPQLRDVLERCEAEAWRERGKA